MLPKIGKSDHVAQVPSVSHLIRLVHLDVDEGRDDRAHERNSGVHWQVVQRRRHQDDEHQNVAPPRAKVAPHSVLCVKETTHA
ncbi:hypothetical protein MRX96_011698 [Rhipicephalus microplus]